jgi:hypothetical protein
MKTIFLTAIALAVSVPLSAQITISSNNMPVANDTMRMSVASAAGIDVSQTGANHTWDFSNLVATSQTVVKYIPSASTPYFFYFIGTYGRKVSDSAGFGTFKFTNLFNFYKKSSTKFTSEGLGLTYSGIPLAADYSDPDEIYQFPLTYNRKDSSTFAVSLNIPTLGVYKSKGYRLTHVDGYGTAVTPYGSFQCIRVRSRVFATDSITLQQPLSVSFGFPNNTEEYHWLTTTEHLPVMEITGNVAAGNFTPTQISYRDSARLWATGITESEFQALNVFPNPGGKDRIVEFDSPQSGQYEFEVFDISGTRISQLSISSNGKKTRLKVNLPENGNSFFGFLTYQGKLLGMARMIKE